MTEKEQKALNVSAELWMAMMEMDKEDELNPDLWRDLRFHLHAFKH